MILTLIKEPFEADLHREAYWAIFFSVRRRIASHTLVGNKSFQIVRQVKLNEVEVVVARLMKRKETSTLSAEWH